MTTRDELISILKSQQWEKAKGELQAFAALEGQTMPLFEGNEKKISQYDLLIEAVESFILTIEQNGWNE